MRKWDSFILLCTSSYVAISETSHTNGHDVRFYGHAFRFSSPVCCRMLRFFVAWCEIPHHTHLPAANTPEKRYRGIKYRCNASTFLKHHGEMGFRNGKRNQRRRDSIAPQTKGGLSIASISALPRNIGPLQVCLYFVFTMRAMVSCGFLEGNSPPWPTCNVAPQPLPIPSASIIAGVHSNVLED